jgi:hypothetical protein
MEPRAESQFTPPCPLCGQGHGRPNGVLMQNHERTITFVCNACDQTWTAMDRVQPTRSWQESNAQARSSPAQIAKVAASASG